MARRFGGKHSPTDVPRAGHRGDAPGGSGDANGAGWQGRRRSRAGGRVNLLFVVPVPLLFGAFGADPAGLALNLAAFGLMMGAAWMTREGLVAEEAYDARTVARRPALPRKIFGSVLTGAGLGVAGLQTGQVLPPVIFAALGAILHFLSFGPDPLRDKGAEGVDPFQATRVAKVIDEAERYLGDIAAAIDRLGDRPLSDRAAAFGATVARMVRTVEEDPRDLTAARRYLGVYLSGARDATVKFADLQARARESGRTDPAARAAYLTLLDDLEQGFSTRTERMLLDDRSNLDVEIDVLRDRLARDGVAARRTPDTSDR